MPALTEHEHIRLAAARNLALLTAGVASLLLFGPGWPCVIGLGVAAIAILVLSTQYLIRRGLTKRRPFVSAKEWSVARVAADNSSPVRLISGFYWGFFIVSGISNNKGSWPMALFAGTICAPGLYAIRKR